MWFSLFDVAGPGDVEDLQPAHKHRKPEATEEQIESDGKQKIYHFWCTNQLIFVF